MTSPSQRTAAHDLQFATAFLHAKGAAPNSWTYSHRAKLDRYYRCMVVSFASIRRTHPVSPLVLYTDVMQLPPPFGHQLAQLGVTLRHAEESYVTTQIFKNSFPGCLYTLDVLHDLSIRADPTMTVLLDSDTIVRRRLRLGGDAIEAYSIDYPLPHSVNGQSRASLALAAASWRGREPDLSLSYLGGEYLAVPASSLAELAAQVSEFWSWLLDQNGIYGTSLTEEHVLTAVLGASSSLQTATDPQRIRRIWTADNYSDVRGDEDALDIWHLPAEKRTGFRRMYRTWLRRGGFDDLADSAFDALVQEAVPSATSPHGRGVAHAVGRRLRSAGRALLVG